MYEVRKKTVTLDVSRISSAGFWAGNGREQVVAGTALGSDCTTVIYTPSKKGVTGKYDANAQLWTEITDNSQTEFWDSKGHSYYVDYPSDDFPSWAIFEAPPAYYVDTETVLYSDGEWKKYPIQIGTAYYDATAHQYLVAEYNFELPENHTFDDPPDEKDGYVRRLVDGQWTYMEDHREKTIYNTADCTDSITVEWVGPIDDGWTLSVPNTLVDKWDGQSWTTDAQAKYEYDYKIVNATRERLYELQVDRLNKEAEMIRRIEGDEDKASEYEAQAKAAYLKIREDNPWPENPASTSKSETSSS